MHIPDYKCVVKKASDGTELFVRGAKWWVVNDVDARKVSKRVRASIAGIVSRAIKRAESQQGGEL